MRLNVVTCLSLFVKHTQIVIIFPNVPIIALNKVF